MAQSSKGKAAHVALLRGINVGGRNKLSMKALAGYFEDAGCEQVRTYIQSGNVVFVATPKVARAAVETVRARVLAETGMAVPLVLRHVDALRALVTSNPYLDATDDHGHLVVMFLEHEPTAEAIAKLDPERSPGDVYTVRGADIFLHLPKGIAESKLTNAYFDSKLKTISTGRNWRTVLTLLEMAEG
jgi:uncharacterized protein (DUF1697 family)